ncbi:MAG: phytanoyl-CoA dioxygenase family protein, partial [Ilumatobacter sp.]
MTITHVQPDTSAEAIHEILAGDGALVIDDLASVESIDAITAEMETFVEATPHGSDDFSGRTTKRTGALIARSPSSRDLVTHPLILDVAGRLMHQASTFQVHLTQLISIGPDSPSQSIHRDEWAFDFFAFPSDVHPQCNTIWAMTDFTEENGATRLIPGSQDWEVDLGHSVEESVPAEMTKGSCLLYTGKVYHGGGANRSDRVRTGLNLTYCVAWLRQEENQYLSCPREVALTLDDDLLKLMGYR